MRTALMMCLLAAPVLAGEVYDTGDPYDGQEISYSPSRVLIRFTDPVRMEEAVLQDESGRNIDIRFGVPEDAEGVASVSVRVTQVLPPGKYRLHWLAFVPSHDHADDGTVRFTVVAPQLPRQAAR